MTISQTITLADNKIITKPRTKTGRPRIVALDAETVAALRGWSARQKRERLAAGEAWVETGLVFTWEDGSVINPERWSDWFEAHTKAAGCLVSACTIFGTRPRRSCSWRVSLRGS